jgi:hypothetical protein
MPDINFKSAIRAALDHAVPDDIIDGVKSAVIAEVENLDPSATIKKTDYFNHSFAPDFVLSWKTGARREETRDLYLRFSLKSSRAAHDFDFLGEDGPIFLSFDSENDDDELSTEVARDLIRAPRSLCTNAPALDRISGGNSASAESVTSPAAPLRNLFRRNVVRGGRGLIVGETADRLDQAVTSDTESDMSYVDRFESVVSGVFSEAASLRLRRAAELVRIALSGDTDRLDRDEETGRLNQALTGGILDDSELRVLLPFLLERAQTINDIRFWRYVGEMMSLAQLESMSSLLAEFDLSPLAKANLSAWKAARSMMSFEPEAIDREGRPDITWKFDAGVLCAVAGVWKIHFSSDHRRGGRTRTDSQLGNWSDLVEKLVDFSLVSVDLQDIARRVVVSAEDEVNVLTDAIAVQEHVEGNFFVRSMSIRTADEDASDILVDFPTLSASGSRVPIVDLARASLRLLGYRYPVDEEEVSELLAT